MSADLGSYPYSCRHCYRWGLRDGKMWCPVWYRYLDDLEASGVMTCAYWLQPPPLAVEYDYWQAAMRRWFGGDSGGDSDGDAEVTDA